MTICNKWYARQPYIIYKHNDIDREHIHIVSVRIDGEGKKINDSHEQHRSSKIRQNLEQKYGLTPASKITASQDKDLKAINELKNFNSFKQSNYQTSRFKDLPLSEALALALRSSLEFNVNSFVEYKNLLNKMGVGVEQTNTKRKGLIYYLVDKKGKRISKSITGSRIGTPFSYYGFQRRLNKNQTNDINAIKAEFRNVLDTILKPNKIIAYVSFISELQAKGYKIEFNVNSDGLLYGVSYTNMKTGYVFKGSELGKEYSANALKDKLASNQMGRTVSNKEFAEIQKDLVGIYKNLRNSNNNFFESTFIKQLPELRKEIIEKLIQIKPDIPLNAILESVDIFINKRLDYLHILRQKETEQFNSRYSDLIKFSHQNIKDVKQKSEFLKKLGVNIEKYRNNRTAFAHYADDSLKLWTRTLKLNPNSFIKIDDEVKLFNWFDNRLLEAIMAKDFSKLPIEKTDLLLKSQILKFLPEDIQIFAQKQLTQNEAVSILKSQPDTKNRLEELLEKGYVILPLLNKQTNNYDYYIGRAGMNTKTYSKLSQFRADELTKFNYPQTFSSIRDMVYTKNGKINARYSLIVAISRASDLKNDFYARDILINKFKFIKERNPKLSIELYTELKADKLDYDKMKRILTKVDANLNEVQVNNYRRNINRGMRM